MKKKAVRKKKAAPRKGVMKRLVAKLGSARKQTRKKLAVKRVPPAIAAPTPAKPVRQGPLHLPSKPEPAYAILHKRDWATKPPPHEFRIPKR